MFQSFNRCSTRGTSALVTAALAVLVGLQRLWLGSLPCDDAFITFRYAWNLAAHGELVYNAGERVFGCTTLLYAALLALGHRLGLPLEDASWWLTLAGDIAVCSLLVRLGEHVYGGRWYGLFGALIWLTHPVVALTGIGGMETSIFTALMLQAAAYSVAGRFGAAFVTAGLLLWTRVDGLVIVPVIVYQWWRAGRPPLKHLPLAMAGGLVATYVGFTWGYYGTPLPLSALAKAQGSRWSASGTGLVAVSYLTSIGGVLSVWYWLLSPHVLLPGGIVRWLVRPAERRPGEAILMQLAGAHAALYVFAGRVTAILYPWYFVPFITLCLLPAMVGVRRLAVTEQGRLNPRAITVAALGIAVAAACCGLFYRYVPVERVLRDPGGTFLMMPWSLERLHRLSKVLLANTALLSLLAVGGVSAAVAAASRAPRAGGAHLVGLLCLSCGLLAALEIDRADLRSRYARRETAYLELGRWLETHGADGDWIGAREIGALGWALLEHPVYDEAGLVTPGALTTSRADWLGRLRPALVAGVSRSDVPNGQQEPGIAGYRYFQAGHVQVWLRADLEEAWLEAPPKLE